MRISILIPCHNEEKSIRKCVESCLGQTRKPDQILVVNNGSTDRSSEILARFGNRIEVITTPTLGNKSYAQEKGLEYVTGDVFVATDGDTILDSEFLEEIEKDLKDPNVAAVGGYVRSIPYNWLTACRAFEYTIGQNIHKLAQSYINFMYVIPGAAGAFKTDIFKQYIKFDHDTITEDLDFTLKYHELGLRIAYNRKAISYTQDPATLSQYTNQIRRWYGGGWQNLRKHIGIIKKPSVAFELALNYIEGMIFPVVMFILPFINIYMGAYLFLGYILGSMVFGIYAASKENRPILVLVPAIYIFLVFINAYVLYEQFFKEIVLKRKNLVWFHPERVEL